METEDTANLTSQGCCFSTGSSSKSRKLAIIGAGPAGLCAARHLFAPGSGFTGFVFEQAGVLGGTWLYTDATGKDRFGIPIHSTLYDNLWTNLPKETMTFPDFEYKDETRSYLPSASILQYLIDYADHYDLHQHIKLYHHVTRIAPVGNSWSVTAVELTSKMEHVSMFDAVMICSGPNIIPVYPQVDGLARFSGRQLHSKEFRKASAFEGNRILIIGLGPSGIDITYCLIPVAKQVIISHNIPNANFFFPGNTITKPEVSSMQDKTVRFSDGTEEEVDVIIHCTGYTYHYPFLTPECGLIVDQYVKPLYRHFINIEHPTMCIIGIPRKCPLQYMVDYQVRAFMNILKGVATLPSKEEMLAQTEEDIAKRAAEGQRKKDYHKMACALNEKYFKQLAELGKLEPVPPVVLQIFCDAFKSAIKDFSNFRKTQYKIVDNENYTKISTKNSTSSVKFADEQLKEIQEIRVMEPEDSADEKNTTVLLSKEETEPIIQEVDEEKEKVHENLISKEVVSSKMTEIRDEATVLETIITKTIEEHFEMEDIIHKQENCGTIRVEAVVEMTPSNVELKNEINEGGESSCSDREEENSPTLITERVNLDLQDSLSKSNCGDEIVKIIQTEEGGGFR